MYELVAGNEVICRFEKPVYITLKSPNGKPQQTEDPEQADCVSLNGTLYQLPSAKNIDRSLPSGFLRKCDGGKAAFETEVKAKKTEIALENTVAEMESAICDLDMMFADSIAELELTICEMDMAMSGQEDA